MDQAHASIAYQYWFSDSEDPPRALGDIVSAGIYVWDSFKSATEYTQAAAQSWKNLIHLNVYCPGLTVSAFYVPSDVQLAKLETPVSNGGSQSISNAVKVILI